MDFPGHKKRPDSKETKVSSQQKIGTLVRPIPSLPKLNNKSYGPQSLSAYLGNGSIPLSQLSVHAKADSSCAQAAAVVKTRGWALPEGGKESVSAAGGAPQKQSATVERPFLDKPLEELTDGDIMQLTREDCRRYLKEKGMRRPSWNKFQAIQQVLSLRGLLDSKTPVERGVHREESSTPKDFAEAASDDGNPPLRTECIGLQNQGVTGEMNSVHPFFSSTNGERGFENPENLDLFSNGQRHLPKCTDEENGSPCHCDCTSSLPDADLTLSLSSSWVKEPFSSLHAGFGSPLPVSLASSTELLGSTSAAVRSMSVINGQGHSPSPFQTSTELGARPTSAHVMAPTSQMTIFYAGLVNVYDDIPDDKAQAIMLLAGCGNPRATSAMHPPASKDHPISPPPHLATSQSVPASTSGDHCRDAIPPPTSAVAVDPAAIDQPCVRRPQTELPQARRASMQRFLEKRKERALAKVPYAGKDIENDDSAPPLDPDFGRLSSFSNSLEAGSASLVPPLQPYMSAAPNNRPLKSGQWKNSSPSRIPRAQEIVLNNKEDKGCKTFEVENRSEKLVMVNSVDAEIIETDEDSASS